MECNMWAGTMTANPLYARVVRQLRVPLRSASALCIHVSLKQVPNHRDSCWICISVIPIPPKCLSWSWMESLSFSLPKVGLLETMVGCVACWGQQQWFFWIWCSMWFQCCCCHVWAGSCWCHFKELELPSAAGLFLKIANIFREGQKCTEFVQEYFF